VFHDYHQCATVGATNPCPKLEEASTIMRYMILVLANAATAALIGGLCPASDGPIGWGVAYPANGPGLATTQFDDVYRCGGGWGAGGCGFGWQSQWLMASANGWVSPNGWSAAPPVAVLCGSTQTVNCNTWGCPSTYVLDRWSYEWETQLYSPVTGFNGQTGSYQGTLLWDHIIQFTTN
jgi:hypothetical protein